MLGKCSHSGYSVAIGIELYLSIGLPEVIILIKTEVYIWIH